MKELLHRFRPAIRRFAGMLDILVFATSLLTVVCLLVYAGYDTGAVNKNLLWSLLHFARWLYVFNILFNLLLRYRDTMAESRFVKRATDILILLTLVVHGKYFLFIALGIYSLAELCYGVMQMLGRRTNPSLILSASFVFFILMGSFVLMLPRCTTTHISYIDSLFMAASAVSMTGLCTVDVPTVFTPAGWLVLAVLMQIGALGVLTFTSFFALFFSGRASIYNQILMRDFVYSKSMSSLMPVILYILLFTLTVEAAGAVAIYFTLPPDFPADTPGRVIFAAFHSLSAFCNAGFTTLPGGMANEALLGGGPGIYLVMTVLILAGGIGFPNLVNFKDAIGQSFRHLRSVLLRRPYERRVHVYDVNTKLVLAWTAVLFVGGAVGFYILEFNHTLEHLPAGEKIVRSIFNSATVRTAGFAISEPAEWLPVTLLMAMFLMWVGCASQSMGGGIKVNAFAAVLLNLRSLIRGRRGVTAFNRTIAPSSIRRANAVVCLSVFAILFYSGALMLLQPELPMKSVMFEAFSAITTIGMSMGITAELTAASKLLVVTAMFLGRVGILSVLTGVAGPSPDYSPHLPGDDIIIS